MPPEVSANAAMPKQAGRVPSIDLPSGALLHDRLGHALAQTRRRNGLLALIRIDLDLQICGGGVHALEVKDIARRLRGALRASDTIGCIEPQALVLILPDLSGLAAAGLLAGKVLATLELNEPRGRRRLSPRLGIALFPAHGDDGEELLQSAAGAAAQARSAGERVAWCAGGARTIQASPQDMTRDLRDAIDQAQLSLDYQPQIDLGQQRLAGLEALLRWRHPILGTIDPEAFVKLAEGSGQIDRIGKWVLAQACADAATWPTERLGPIRVAVNFSTAQMVSDDLPKVVARALQQAGLPASRLELELTERSVLDGGERLLAVLSRLRAMGVGLALDDFGTGYASLRHLAWLPLDALKIDRSFVANLEKPAHLAIVQSMIELAHRLGLRVTAEGVEGRSQLATLRALGCDEVQGHLHGKPLTAAALGPWLSARANRQR